jgi:predicted transcriptional regulator
MKKTAFLSIKMDSELRTKIENLAKAERRSFADQAAYLIEKGLNTLEPIRKPTAKAKRKSA